MSPSIESRRTGGVCFLELEEDLAEVREVENVKSIDTLISRRGSRSDQRNKPCGSISAL